MARKNQSDPTASLAQQATMRNHPGRANRLLSAVARERWRQSALATRPWERSTGPRTAAGKAQAALNGKTRQKGEKSFRERRAELADVGRLAKEMENLRNALQASQQDITLYAKYATTS